MNKIVHKHTLYIRLGLILLIVLSIGGCKSSSNTTAFNTTGAIVDKDKNQILADVLASDLKYNDIAVKASIELLSLQSGKSMKTNCYVKIIRNKEIQLSVRMPFINSEVFRLNLTPDSIFVIDRIGKKYAAESFKELVESKGINFNFYNIQALFTNSLFVPGSSEVSKKSFKDFFVTKQSEVYNLSIQDQNQTAFQFVVNSSDRIQETKITNEKYKFNTTWQYSDFVKNSSGDIYPTVISTKTMVDNKAVGLNMSYTDLELNTGVVIDNQMPKKYEQTHIRNILNAYLKSNS